MRVFLQQLKGWINGTGRKPTDEDSLYSNRPVRLIGPASKRMKALWSGDVFVGLYSVPHQGWSVLCPGRLLEVSFSAGSIVSAGIDGKHENETGRLIFYAEPDQHFFPIISSGDKLTGTYRYQLAAIFAGDPEIYTVDTRDVSVWSEYVWPSLYLVECQNKQSMNNGSLSSPAIFTTGVPLHFSYTLQEGDLENIESGEFDTQRMRQEGLLQYFCGPGFPFFSVALARIGHCPVACAKFTGHKLLGSRGKGYELPVILDERDSVITPNGPVTRDEFKAFIRSGLFLDIDQGPAFLRPTTEEGWPDPLHAFGSWEPIVHMAREFIRGDKYLLSLVSAESEIIDV